MTNLILPTSAQPKFGVVAFFAREKDGLIGIVDLWPELTPDAQRDTSRVTDAPQIVLNELAQRGFPINDRVVLYLDENNRWDQILVHNGSFDNFYLLHAPSWEVALERLLKDGIVTASDLRKPAVVDKSLKF